MAWMYQEDKALNAETRRMQVEVKKALKKAEDK
jgi:hypothetical protein